MLRLFARDLCKDSVALLSGIVSVGLMFLGTFTSLPPWVVWPAAYLSLGYAAYRLWRQQYAKVLDLEGKLAARGPEAAIEAEARAQVQKLTTPELRALKQLAVCVQLTGEQLVDFCRRNNFEVVTAGMLAQKVSFLTRDYTTGAWSIVPGMQAAVGKVLSELNV